MDIVHLQYFQVVAEQENLTRAAEILHISQPALSASISKLEKELGVQLFDRVGRRIQLNQYGRIYSDYVNQALNNLNNAARELDNYTRRGKQIITISTVSIQAIQDLLSDFMDSHANIGIRRYEIMPRDVQDELKNNDCDFVITATSGPFEQTENACIVKREKLYLAVQKNHPLSKRERISLIEAKEEAFVSLPEGYSFREITEGLCRRAGFSCDVLHECFHCQLLNYVSDGIGVAIVTEEVRDRERQRLAGSNNQIVFLELTDEEAFRNIIFLWNQDKVLSAAAKTLLEYASRYYQDDVKKATHTGCLFDV